MRTELRLESSRRRSCSRWSSSLGWSGHRSCAEVQPRVVLVRPYVSDVHDVSADA